MKYSWGKKGKRKEKKKISWKTRFLLHSSLIGVSQKVPAMLILNINVSLKYDLEFSKDSDYSKIRPPLDLTEEDRYFFY